jgi:hypothetical protein
MLAPMVARPVCVLLDPDDPDPSHSIPGVIMSEYQGDSILIALDTDPHNPLWFPRVNKNGNGYYRLQDGNCDTQLLPIP